MYVGRNAKAEFVLAVSESGDDSEVCLVSDILPWCLKKKKDEELA